MTTLANTATLAPPQGGVPLGVHTLRRIGSDVVADRESIRRVRLYKIVLWLGLPTIFLTYRLADGRPFNIFALPQVDLTVLVPILFFVALIGVLLGSQVVTGRSPHTIVRPEQIDVRLSDVVGVDVVKDEVVRSLNLFLAHRSFASEMGGRPRRGLLFEGSPGTGKTHMAKAMAAEAGVPFLVASAPSFQSSYYGATARKIRSFFKVLRATARKEGGAIAFIDEFDAIGGKRNGMEMTALPMVGHSCQGVAALGSPLSGATLAATTANSFGTSDLAGPVVNELLVQMQSFEEPTGLQKAGGKIIDAVNLLLPAHRQFSKPAAKPANILVIAATNRADGLDPALTRPGRFDRRLTFELPTKDGRRALADHFLSSKAHSSELDTEERRDALAAVTTGYSPAMIEGLFDEALINAVRRGAREMSVADVEHARLSSEVGLGQPVAYTDHEARLIATHEAGHATMAHLVAPQRRLEILTIIKRRGALGMLAHGDREDVFTRSRSEMLALVQIAMGGQVAEELFFGDVSTGPAGDLAYATGVAAEMVGSAGMRDSLISLAAVQNSGLSDTNIVGRVLGDADSRADVERLLVEQKQVALDLLGRNRHLVEALRDALLDRHELIGEQITDVLEGAARVIDLRDPAEVPAGA